MIYPLLIRLMERNDSHKLSTAPSPGGPKQKHTTTTKAEAKGQLCLKCPHTPKGKPSVPNGLLPHACLLGLIYVLIKVNVYRIRAHWGIIP